MVQKKKNEKPKTAKEIKKEIEDKTFGMKNKKKSREIIKAKEKVITHSIIEKKKSHEEKIVLIQPKAPIGVDPKTIPCVYFLNKMCAKGDKCKYGHEKKAVVSAKETEEKTEKTKLVCRFLIDAINNGQFISNWKCPDPNCKDIHKLEEKGDVVISLEEFIELKRQEIPEGECIDEEAFKKWKERKRLEDELHKKRVKALKEGQSGCDLFKERPDMFVDDEEALDCDYAERNYEDEELEEKLDNLNIQ